ncbi:MAG TPA: GNAT family N-acetyltransferase [Actinospica sp.]|nr:GNAT family N-acetyltransferase [Actinospica sp.]
MSRFAAPWSGRYLGMGAAIDHIADIQIVSDSGTASVTSPEWEAIAQAAGTPFHPARFLLPWWRHRQAESPESRLLTATVVDHGQAVGLCAFELVSGALSFAGGDDVVDYMGPVALPGREGEVAAALVRWMLANDGWTSARLAGLAQNSPAAQAFIEELTRADPCAVVEPYDHAPQIEISPDGYLSLLNSKRRSDVLRKRNRLIEAFGDLELVDSDCDTARESLERLLSWKAEAGPAMREFVAEYGDFVRDMVTGLAAVDACHVVELRADGVPLAAVITLTHRDTVSIYNMAYDMKLLTGDRAGLAPGVVLVSLLVERTLDRGLRFDFLKGAQDYKVRLGGVPVELIRISIATR